MDKKCSQLNTNFRIYLVRPMARILPVFLLTTLLPALEASPVVLRSGDPALDGKDHLLSEADFRALLGVGRAHFASFRPRPSIYRVTVVSATEVHAWYHITPHTDDEYVEWLVIERVKNQWRVTGKSGYQFTDLTKRSSQPLAGAMTSFNVMKHLSILVKLAPTSGA